MWRSLVLGILPLFLLVGCAGTGPANLDFVSASRSEEARFALVDVDETSIGVVSRWHRPSLSAVFGDYRRPAANRIGIGDAVQIHIWEAGTSALFVSQTDDRAASMTRATQIPEQVVSREGDINVPYAGRIKIAGKTPSEVEDLIVSQLHDRSAQPQALVTLTHNLTNSVTVTGDVTNSARLALNAGGDRLLDVITQAGGARSPIDETYITLSRNGQTLSVPMQVLLTNSKENVYVRPGDTITVSRAIQSFTAVGATGRQAQVQFDAAGITLEEALGKSGGLLDEKADPRGVFVLRYEPTELARNFPSVPSRLLTGAFVPVVYRLDMKKPMSLFYARRFAIRNKDILYVSNAPLAEIGKVMGALVSIASPALTAYTAAAVVP